MATRMGKRGIGRGQEHEWGLLFQKFLRCLYFQQSACIICKANSYSKMFRAIRKGGCVSTCSCVFACVWEWVHLHTRACVCLECFCVCMHVLCVNCVFVCGMFACVSYVFVCVSVHVFMWVLVCLHMCAYLLVSVNVVHVCTHVCACTYACVHGIQCNEVRTQEEGAHSLGR
jgi:hypothetical protein